MVFISSPNYEQKNSYEAIVSVSDSKTSTDQNITIVIVDQNDAPIINDPVSFSINEDETAIGQITASDEDGDAINFSLSGDDANLMSIDSNGNLSLNDPADYETKQGYSYNIVASDPSNSSIQSSKSGVTNVQDENLWSQSNSTINNCAGDMDMSKDGTVLVCREEAGNAQIDIRTYLSNSSNSSWSVMDSSNSPFPSRGSDGTWAQAISLSDNGEVFALSSPIHWGDTRYQTGPGAVWVFSRNGNTWSNKNNTSFSGGSENNAGIRGVSDGDYFGVSISLNSDGSRIAVGAHFADGTKENGDGIANAGHIRVFEWTEITGQNRTEWVQLGGDMDGYNDSPGSGLGTSIALSNDGNVVIGGAPNREYARVFSWDGSSWNIEATFQADANSSDCFGGSVDIDADGDTVVVSGNGCDGENDRGYAKVYRKSGGAWSQLGSTILGEYDDDGRGFQADEFGHEVSISDNGNIIAISSRKNPGSLDTSGQYKSAGHVRVFEYLDGNWNQLENDIDGAEQDSRFGDIVVISGDGKKVVVQQDEDEKVFTFTRD